MMTEIETTAGWLAGHHVWRRRWTHRYKLKWHVNGGRDQAFCGRWPSPDDDHSAIEPGTIIDLCHRCKMWSVR